MADSLMNALGFYAVSSNVGGMEKVTCIRLEGWAGPKNNAFYAMTYLEWCQRQVEWMRSRGRDAHVFRDTADGEPVCCVMAKVFKEG